MNLVRKRIPGQEPEWDDFSIDAVDFRPEWDGDLVNVFTTIRPLRDEQETKDFAVGCARQLASWIVTRKKQFGVGDRFQIIVGWPKNVRQAGRQIIKIGGDLSEIKKIACGELDVPMNGNWNFGIFGDSNSEQRGGG